MRRVVEVFTNKSVEFMLTKGGSASWVVSKKGADNIEFCICTRNDDRARDDDAGARPEARNAAFMVGRVSGIAFVERQNDVDRYLIKFSEYAEVSVPDFRAGSMRNPVLYSDVETCKGRNLDIDALKFKPMPEPTSPYTPSRKDVVVKADSGSKGQRGLTITQAKEGLAIYFDVPIDAISVTVTA